ncbi:hypothetical protein GCM10023065_31740 [Microbacterium laevaniformans]|uniref:AI-2E family transporter n=1 Tax=Microbacterium laevaniformans TaxID=36807 RepID=UPI0031E815FC
MPARSRSLTADLTEQITESVGGYLGGMVVLAFFNAVVSFILYTVLGLPFPALMAVVAFCLTIIRSSVRCCSGASPRWSPSSPAPCRR